MVTLSPVGVNRAASPGRVSAPVSQPRRVLVIEDDAGQACLIRRTLERVGYAVEVAGDGDTGLALCETGAYDVLVVDHQLPGTGGLEVLRTLATRGALPPTIMVTGHGDEAIAVEAMKLGAGDYLVKDVEGRYLTLLPAMVARLLHQQRRLEETRQAEETLRQQAALLDLTHDTIMVLDMEERIVFWNRGAEERYGWTKDEVLGQSPHMLLHTQFPQPLTAIRAAFLRQGRWDGELVHTTRAGARIVVASRWALQRDAAGQPVAILEINNDITQRKRAEEALRHHLEWLDVTLASIGDAVLTTDSAGALTLLNPVAEELTGWKAQAALGRHIDEILQLYNVQTRQPVQGPVRRVLQTEQIVSAEPDTVLVTRDGRHIPIADSGAPIRGSNGVLQGVVVVLRNISEYKRLEEHLRQSQKIEAIGTLAGGIAHDFNNILAAILGFTELAAYDVPPASAAGRCLQEVLTAGKRAKELVQQILAFSRKTMTGRKPVRLHALLKEALTLLRASLPSTIQIRTHMTDEADTVLADATQMHQVLMNLCANAEYAMRDTGGILEVRLEAVDVDVALAATHPDLQPGPYVQLTVRDTGHGMTPEVLEHIFEPYFTTKPQGEGTGMGLAVVHGIVLSHGGAMTVTSAPGQGTMFAIYLPRLTEAAADDLPQAEEPLPGGTERILFVDDEAAIAYLGEAVLTRLGYQVVVCLSSTEALETFRTASPPFDLVITDQTMPHLTGTTLTRALRDMRPDLPIILCTGFSRTIDAESARASGIDALLMKPWHGRELARTIRRVLEQRTQSQPDEPPLPEAEGTESAPSVLRG